MNRDFFRKYLDILNESSEKTELNESIELHDSFDIELNEHFVIETGIIGFTEDGIILEADETLLGLFEVNNILCEDETYDQKEEEVAEDEQSGKQYQPMDRYKHLVDRAKGDWKWKREDGSPVTPEDLETIKKTKRDMLNQMQSDEVNPKDAEVDKDENVFTKFMNLFKENAEEETTQPKPDTNKKDKPSDNYIDTKPATDTNIDTSKLIDKEPLKAKPLKGDPKDYMAKEGYEDETMMSVYQDHKTTQKDGKVSSDFSSRSFSRNPKTGTGSYLMSRDKDGEVTQDFQQNVSKPWMDYTEKGGQGPMSQFRASVNEAEYQGRKVPLGKPMAGDVAKSKVYVRKPNGKVVKVNFGDKNMKIKKSNPNRRKSFRARHRCENPGPRWKARYWSCRAW
jgi:hypothetical protein